MKRVIFFVLLPIINLLSYSQNLVLNPGFETWEKTNKPAGWTTAQNCLKDSDNIKSGSYSCRQDGGTKYLGQTLSIVPGKIYNLSFFYKTLITGTGNGCRIWCYWRDPEGNNITDISTDDILRPSKYLKSEIWQRFSVDFTVPAGASAFYLEVRTYQNSIAWFDDFDFDENVTTFDQQQHVRDVKVYPDPAHDFITISNLSDLQHISIQSLMGTLLWSSGPCSEQTVTISVSGLADGIYIVRILTSNKLITKKFIKKAY